MLIKSKDPLPWSKAWTLEDYALSLIQQNKTQSEEFKTLLRVYGRDKLREIWSKYKANQQPERG